MTAPMTADERTALCAGLTAALGIDLPESVRMYGPGEYVFAVLSLDTAEKLLARLSPSPSQEGGTD